MNISAKTMLQMLLIMEKEYLGKEDAESANKCRKIASDMLQVFAECGGDKFEISGYQWIEEMKDSI